MGTFAGPRTARGAYAARRSFEPCIPRGVQGERAVRLRARFRLRVSLERGDLEAAILDPFTGTLHPTPRITVASARRRSDDRKGESTNTGQSQDRFSPGQAIRRSKCGHQADPTGKNPRGDRSLEGKNRDGKSGAASTEGFPAQEFSELPYNRASIHRDISGSPSVEGKAQKVRQVSLAKSFRARVVLFFVRLRQVYPSEKFF